MQTMSTPILTINGGSSSIKFAVFDAVLPLRWMLSGVIEGIGLSQSTLRIDGPTLAKPLSRIVAAGSQMEAIDTLMECIEKNVGPQIVRAVGHRVVHGGPNYSQPQRITTAVIEELQRLRPFDPEHLPAEIRLIEAMQARFPSTPQVACFDTAFHHDLPRVAQLLPIPHHYQEQGVRRYGFHGLSYEFLMQELSRLAGHSAAAGRVILAHLGSGASLAAVRAGRPVDTTMSFTPTAGVPMSTRAGDLDPGLVCYLARTDGMSAEQFQEMVNSHSGLLGVSGISSDMRELLACESGEPRSADAIGLFCYEVKKRIGGLAAALGGVDTLVFSGGIGERSPMIRHRICDGLEFLGVELANERNQQNADLISTDAGRVAVRVIPTNEELMIGKSVCRVLGLTPAE